VHRDHPEVVFLAEAFTRPEMMHALGKVGFQQSYTYFTWRTTKDELTEYVTELATTTSAYFRPNFWVNTPDINPFHLHSGMPAVFAQRAILAAMLAPSWGVYSGFELFEHAPVAPGREEYLDSEKYQYRPRNFAAEPNLNVLLGRLNAIRHQHPALQQLRRVHFHSCDNPEIIAFSKHDGDDHVLVICSLDPWNGQSSRLYLDLTAFGADPSSVVTVHDELTGDTYLWGASNYVELSPLRVAHIFSVQPS